MRTILLGLRDGIAMVALCSILSGFIAAAADEATGRHAYHAMLVAGVIVSAWSAARDVKRALEAIK